MLLILYDFSRDLAKEIKKINKYKCIKLFIILLFKNYKKKDTNVLKTLIFIYYFYFFFFVILK